MSATDLNPVEAEYDNVLAPRRNPDLLGHRSAEQELLRWVLSERMPHAIIIGGARGIGKATLAFRLARFVLARADQPAEAGLFAAPPPAASLAVAPDHPVFRRVSSGGHADLLTIARAWDPKRKRLRGEIIVDDVRTIAGFLHLTAAEGGWRVVVVDGADEMNRSAANALLKVLEEPPARTLLLLVCHAAGQLLPTIRSRCRRLMLEPLAESEVQSLLVQHRPDLSADQRTALASLAEGSIGRALELADGDGVALYCATLELVGRLPQLDGVALQSLADRLVRADEGEFATVVDLLLDLLARFALGASKGEPMLVPLADPSTIARLTDLLPGPRWLALWDELREFTGRAVGLNFDRKQIVLDMFGRMRATVSR